MRVDNELQRGVPVKRLVFPDGQTNIAIADGWNNQGWTIKGPIANPADLFEVQMINDILRNRGVKSIKLDITYLLGARTDRRMMNDTMTEGGSEYDMSHPFTLKIVADTINRYGFDRVSVFDPHSDVATALIDRSVAFYPSYEVNSACINISRKDLTIVIPDAGAGKRIEKLCPGRTTVQFLKHRDTATGKLSGFKLYGDVKGKACLIVDDICDGGGTFAAEEKVLREAGADKVYLFVTHGIFSKGMEPLNNFDWVYTTNSYNPKLQSDKVLRTVYNVQ